ncbi:MAG: hypothetical protein ACI4WS_08265, partial [Oscillospiraceae bacterium]
THATSLEGWDSTIELHPQLGDLTLTLNYYSTFPTVCQELSEIFLRFCEKYLKYYPASVSSLCNA